jgi:hypothetical protein
VTSSSSDGRDALVTALEINPSPAPIKIQKSHALVTSADMNASVTTWPEAAASTATSESLTSRVAALAAFTMARATPAMMPMYATSAGNPAPAAIPRYTFLALLRGELPASLAAGSESGFEVPDFPPEEWAEPATDEPPG